MDLSTLESAWLREVADEYRQAGYEVEVNPTLDEGSNLRPDLLARRGDETILIEARAPGMTANDTADLAKFARERGWRFEVLSLGQRTDEEDAMPEVLPRNDLLERLMEARELVSLGHTNAAVLLLWSVIEGALYWAIRREGGTLVRTSPRQLIRAAHAMNLLRANEEAVLSTFAAIRNQIAHGRLTDRPSAADMAQFLSTVSRILSKV